MAKLGGITPVPTSEAFVDIILSKVQRKTPTDIRKFKKHLGSVRKFYTRKIRTLQALFEDRLEMIIKEFPHLKELHPFFSMLLNVLYQNDRYKIALANVLKVKNQISRVGRDKANMVKYADSPYRCKCLKRAAFGHMVKCVKRLGNSLKYLEEVRQHMSRLPAINPAHKTILVCGFPNVGKSSFLNKTTVADVDVQSYEFTTKGLYIGHFEYNYSRYQVIDTPGLLDRELGQRNVPELQTITALAFLNACILFIIDPSQECGRTIAEQVELFRSLKPTFRQNPVLLVANKTDTKRVQDLCEEEKEMIRSMQNESGVLGLMEMSTLTEEGVMDVRNRCCEVLIKQKVEQNLRKVENDKDAEISLQGKLLATQPETIRDPPALPEPVAEEIRRKEAGLEPLPRSEITLEKDLERDQGADYYTDLRKHWNIPNPEERYDKIPEIYEGKNIMDFYRPSTLATELRELEMEEAELEASGFYEPPPPETAQERRTRLIAEKIRKVIKIRKITSKVDKSKKAKAPKSQARLPRDVNFGMAPNMSQERGRSRERSQNRRSVTPADHKRSESRPKPRSQSGVRDSEMQDKVDTMKKKTQRKLLVRDARKGEADRHVFDLKPKHLFCGKRGNGKLDRR